MSLDLRKLTHVKELDSGDVQARCPACAEGGHDASGEHLRVYADGRFGCCVHPQDREHRRRIFALAGDGRPMGIKVKVAARTAAAARPNILGRLGRLFESGSEVPTASDGSDGQNEVEQQSAEARTARTGVSNSSGDSAQTQQVSEEESRTLRTSLSYPRVYSKEYNENDDVHAYTLKGFCPPVRNVRESEAGFNPPSELQEGVRDVRSSEQPPNSDLGMAGMAAVSHAEHGEPSEEDLERKMNESPY